MKLTILILLIGLCDSCAYRPKITTVDPVTGAVTTYDLGGAVMARTEGVIISIEVPNGPKMKYSSIAEDSTEVGKELIRTGGAVAGGIILNRGEEIREGTKQIVVREGTKVELGRQGVQKFTEGETTKRFIHSTVNPNIK